MVKHTPVAVAPFSSLLVRIRTSMHTLALLEATVTSNAAGDYNR